MNVDKFKSYHYKILKNCVQVIVGKDDVISLLLTSFICHVLLEDVPGT